jgi:hypothetical protein
MVIFSKLPDQQYHFWRMKEDAVQMSDWKRLFVRAAGFGVGIVIAAALIIGASAWYRNRPKPWTERALTATFTTMSFKTQPSETSYVVEFNYDVQNNTDSTYRLNPDSLVLMARSSTGSLTKEWGDYQTSEATLTGPAFIPAHAKAGVTLRTAYQYPSEFTAADKDDAKKVGKSVDRRLAQLAGIVIFDEALHYRVDLDAPWQKWDGVKNVNEANKQTSEASHFVVDKLWVNAVRHWGWEGLSSWSDEQILRNLSTRAGFRAAFPEYDSWDDEQIKEVAAQTPPTPYRGYPSKKSAIIPRGAEKLQAEPPGFTPVREISVPKGWKQGMYSASDIDK